MSELDNFPSPIVFSAASRIPLIIPVGVPTILPGPALGFGGFSVSGSNALCHVFLSSTSSSLAAGVLCTVTFSAPLNRIPRTLLTPTSAAALAIFPPVSIGNVTLTKFDLLANGTALAHSPPYTWDVAIS